MFTNELEKVIISDNKLKKLGFEKEEPIKTESGNMVVWSVSNKKDSFIEIVNYFNHYGDFLKQICNRRIVDTGVTDYTKTEIEMIVKRFL